MPAKKATSSGGARSKRAAGLQQPILSFQSQRKPSFTSDKSKPTTTAGKRSRPALETTPSIPEVEIEASPEIEVEEVGNRDVVDTGKRRQLDVKSKEWKGLMKEANEAMGGMKPIHAGPDTHNNVHHILRVFDMTSKYGPCVGVTRLQRWERAKKWGLNPPEEIRTILTTEQGEDDVTYRENVLYGWV
ncbi:hypothetical protein IAR55_002172 [Kwoniella newhampshirensis]|uniref:DNA polymerase delta subunit 4 n=1 Tax=Kwoniella newhampshirensis TaxID=1651941 RepID=A0AAW0Z123_9TREE